MIRITKVEKSDYIRDTGQIQLDFKSLAVLSASILIRFIQASFPEIFREFAAKFPNSV